jgi:hypothetical protein
MELLNLGISLIYLVFLKSEFIIAFLSLFFLFNSFDILVYNCLRKTIHPLVNKSLITCLMASWLFNLYFDFNTCKMINGFHNS